MKIKLSKDPFLKALGLAVSIINPKNPLPILSNLLIETCGKDEVRVIATDLEIGLATHTPAQVQEEGSITVPARKLFDIVRELPEGEFDLQVTKNNSVHIKYLGGEKVSQFKIMGIPKDEYPKLLEYSLENAVNLSQKALQECLSLTSFAMSRDETRYVLNGCLLDISGRTLKIVATDGRRLAFIKKDLEEEVVNNFKVNIPAKTVNELSKLLEENGVVKIVLVKNQIVFDFGKTYLISRLIEGHFPNHEQVIPKEEKTIAQVSVSELLQSVRRAALLTSQESQAVKIEVGKNKIAISSRSPNLGEAREEIQADIKGEDVIIGFNPIYLIDVLRNLKVESITLSLTSSDKPGLIKAGGGDYLYVVMPMQLTT